MKFIRVHDTMKLNLINYENEWIIDNNIICKIDQRTSSYIF